MCVYVYVWTCMSVCVFAWACMHVSIYMCVHAYAWVQICVRKCACVHAYMFISIAVTAKIPVKHATLNVHCVRTEWPGTLQFCVFPVNARNFQQRNFHTHGHVWCVHAVPINPSKDAWMPGMCCCCSLTHLLQISQMVHTTQGVTRPVIIHHTWPFTVISLLQVSYVLHICISVWYGQPYAHSMVEGCCIGLSTAFEWCTLNGRGVPK
jgi:hypothetical protein